MAKRQAMFEEQRQAKRRWEGNFLENFLFIVQEGKKRKRKERGLSKLLFKLLKRPAYYMLMGLSCFEETINESPIASYVLLLPRVLLYHIVLPFVSSDVTEKIHAN